jgi:imidazolonepropionase-like amidohydrolase
MRPFLFLVLAAAVSFAAAGSAVAQVTALTHATVIDGSGDALQRDVTIVIENGRIREMGPRVAAPAGAAVVDLTGKFLTPGIINAHGHVGPAPRDPQLRRYALYGVTTTTSMASDPDDIVAFKARQAAGDLRGARILTVKYRFTTLLNGGDDYKTPEAARAHVDEIAGKGADFIKVWLDTQGGRVPKLSRDYVHAVFEQARKHNKITMAHVVELMDARMAVDEGVNLLVHNVRDQEIPVDFLATLKQKNVSVISTLAREEGMFVYGNESADFSEDPFFLKGLTSAQRERLPQKRAQSAKDPQRALWLRMFETDKKNVKAIFDAGIKLGFGTDSGGDPNRYFVQGFAEHRQMDLLRDAGLTPMQIIQAFSKTNAELLGIDKDFGTLAKGKAADLLVLPRNPLDDITNMRSFEAVYLGGKRFE